MSNLSNQDKAIYAILADNVYWDVRKGFKETSTNEKDFTNSNWTPVPDGWTVIGKYDVSGSGINQSSNPDLKGFSARVYQNTDTKEVVIAYEGTDAPDWHDWIFGNLKSTLGIGSEHLIQAAELYEKVRNDMPVGTQITFTGHSLGGGIAFPRKCVTAYNPPNRRRSNARPRTKLTSHANG